MAKSAADLALMMNVMAGFDPRDSTSVERPKEDYLKSLNKDVRGLRVGLPKEYFGEGIEPGVRKAIEEAVRWFTSQGAKTIPIELPNAKLGVPVPDPGLVIGYYDSEDLPVYDHLAAEYCVVDRWFSSVPGATLRGCAQAVRMSHVAIVRIKAAIACSS